MSKLQGLHKYIAKTFRNTSHKLNHLGTLSDCFNDTLQRHEPTAGFVLLYYVTMQVPPGAPPPHYMETCFYNRPNIIQAMVMAPPYTEELFHLYN